MYMYDYAVTYTWRKDKGGPSEGGFLNHRLFSSNILICKKNIIDDSGNHLH